MIDVAIVGGGLAGLALAHSLQARGLNWALFEARPRLGGRVLTVRTADGLALDLGPTWYWPDTQPSMARLVSDLGLDTLEQADDGRVWLLDDPGAPPTARAWDAAQGRLLEPGEPGTPGAVHGGARRLVHGMGAIVQALASALPADRLHTGQAVRAVHDGATHVELHIGEGDAARRVAARRVALMLPPRVVAEAFAFEPPLPPELAEALGQTSTWMGTAAKAAVRCEHAAWRDLGLTGNAWVTHPQAVLAEAFDAGDDTRAALAGFIAPGAAERAPFARSMPLLLQSQVQMLFGTDVGECEVHWHDWATEAETCSAADRREGPVPHPAYGDARLQQGWWDERLWFGGSETARQGGGYLEGALSSAARLRRELTQPARALGTPAAPALDDLLQRYGQSVQSLRQQAPARYRAQLTHALSTQADEPLTQAALQRTLASVYEDALKSAQDLPWPRVAPAPQAGRHAWTPRLLQPFDGLADELLAEALMFNAGSCALSNFPAEHRPSGDDVRRMRGVLAQGWQAFALDLNSWLLQRT